MTLFTVSVTFVEAKNLYSPNPSSVSISLQGKIGNSVFSSKNIQKTQNPIWNETFSLTYDQNHDNLSIMLYDGSFLLANETLSMKNFNTQISDFWLNLKQGAIHLKIHIVPKIFLKVLEAKNLPALGFSFHLF
jgi:hypothetical protein